MPGMRGEDYPMSELWYFVRGVKKKDTLDDLWKFIKACIPENSDTTCVQLETVGKMIRLYRQGVSPRDVKKTWKRKDVCGRSYVGWVIAYK